MRYMNEVLWRDFELSLYRDFICDPFLFVCSFVRAAPHPFVHFSVCNPIRCLHTHTKRKKKNLQSEHKKLSKTRYVMASYILQSLWPPCHFHRRPRRRLYSHFLLFFSLLQNIFLFAIYLWINAFMETHTFRWMKQQGKNTQQPEYQEQRVNNNKNPHRDGENGFDSATEFMRNGHRMTKETQMCTWNLWMECEERTERKKQPFLMTYAHPLLLFHCLCFAALCACVLRWCAQKFAVVICFATKCVRIAPARIAVQTSGEEVKPKRVRLRYDMDSWFS